jgi:hypothetical protein
VLILVLMVIAIFAIGRVIVQLDRNAKAVQTAERLDRNAKAAQTAERLIDYCAATDPEHIRYWVNKLMTDQELVSALLADNMQLTAKGGAIELTAFPTVTQRGDVVTIEQDGKRYELRADGQQLQLIERGARGGMRETVLNVTALLRVLVMLNLVKENKSSPP